MTIRKRRGSRRRRVFVAVFRMGVIGVVLFAVVLTWGIHRGQVPFLTPPVPPYPSFADRNAVIAQARAISDKQEAYIKDWLDGKVSARFPDALLPSGADTTTIKDLMLVKPEDVTPDEQWGIRKAAPVDLKATLGQFPDPHCTYLIVPVFFVPFGSKVVIEAEFPHCRFFDIQVTPSFQPEYYHYAGWSGVPEVPLVDADIDPLPGSVNPFRVGADRNTKNRKYRVTLRMAVGDAVALNKAFQPPYYRAKSNDRTGGAIMYQGPWGDPKSKPWGHGRGLWDTGQLWIRYYAPDHGAGALGGVPLPKVHYELPDGRRFFLRCDVPAAMAKLNKTRPAATTPPEEPSGGFGPGNGWGKQWGIFRSIFGGLLGASHLGDEKYLRALDRGVEGRGEDLPAPGHYEPSATTCTYINYLNRPMSVGHGKVVVITGKMPTVPDTRNGQPVMRRAEARYWSLTGYEIALPDADGFVGAALHSIMDDEVIRDNRHRYVIVLSRPEDRPSNATAKHGVTWVNWGPTSRAAWTLRWLSVYPEWSFEKAPDERRLGRETDSASTRYDKRVIGYNDQSGFLKAFQPVVHYMSKSEFESLGAPVSPDAVPVWKERP